MSVKRQVFAFSRITRWPEASSRGSPFFSTSTRQQTGSPTPER